ncbi:hypothetical protein VBY75_08415 [Idiomarina sp. HB]|uniref:hypothetical protein n=1 Tax=Idiomarina sp. HB TaxID=3110479 RepID=UPI003A7FDD2E
MKFNAFGLCLELKKGKIDNSEKVDADLIRSHITKLNNQHIEYLRKLSLEEISSRLTSISYEKVDSLNAERCLKENGIVAFPSVFEEQVRNTDLAISQVLDIVSNFNKSEKVWDETQKYLIQKGSSRIRGYNALASYAKPVIFIRDGSDEGMIDVFNADILFPDFFNEVKNSLSEDSVTHLLSESGKRLKPKNFNLYVNKGVVNTRGFHVDSYSSQVKGFVYLSDVFSLEQGPYTYVKESSDDSTLHSLNQAISGLDKVKTEAPIIFQKNIVPMFGGKGSFIVSDQSGIHRGFPQCSDAFRAVAVMNYTQV